MDDDAENVVEIKKLLSDRNSEIGVLFLHHDISQVAANNLKSIREHNPEACIATISPGESFPGGYLLSATPELCKIYEHDPKGSNDILVCSWFLQRKERCDKWWIVEWDTYCSVSIKEYYAPVWSFPFVAAAVYRTSRERDWPWFRHMKDLPESHRSFAIGAVPFLYLISDEALKAICESIIQQPLAALNNELRFATVANKCGFPPCGFSPPNDQISWFQPKSRTIGKGVYHPVKHLVNSSGELNINHRSSAMDISDKSSNNKIISVIMSVVERPNQLEWCLHHIRAVYKDISITVISDGKQCPEYNTICNLYSACYVEGERLKIASKGGKWWQRTLKYAFEADSDFIIKIDPDTKFQRRIEFFTDYDISGTLISKGGSYEHIQGGVQMFSKSAVKRMLETDYFSDPKLTDPTRYAWDESLVWHANNKGYLCTDAMLRLAKLELNLSWGDWQEVRSYFNGLPENHERYAITHGHKWQSLK